MTRTWPEHRAEFPAMGEHIADAGIGAMQWAQAPPESIAEAEELLRQLERERWGALPRDRWGRPTEHPSNDRILEQVAGLVREAIGFALLGVDPRTWCMGPACIQDGIVDGESIGEAGFQVEINDHGNVTVLSGDDIVWSCV